MNSKIMILDGNSLLFRAFYAMPPLKTKRGLYTNAVYGFLGMLYKLMETYSPGYICVAFDPQKPTFRHEQYKEYKAGRAKAPNELIQQFELIREVLKLHNIKCVEINGFEADDVAGTLSKIAENQGASVYLVTSDKDYLQLIDENIIVLLTKKGVTNIKEMNIQTMDEDYGISPAQFVDLKALMGDQSDNIPGVAGVGEKTAVKLIKEYKNLDNIYENIENIKGKLKEKLETSQVQAYMSQTLAKIVRDIPVEFNIEDYKVKEPELEKLMELFDELEFRGYKKKFVNLYDDRVLTESTVPVKSQISMFDSLSNENNIEKDSLNLVYIDNNPELEKIVESLNTYSKIALKFLLDGDRALYGKAVALGISNYKSVYYIDFDKVDESDALNKLKNIFEDINIKKVGHGLKNEIIYLMKHSIELNNYTFDSELGKYLLDPSENSYNVDKIAYEYLGEEIPSETDYLGTGKKKISYEDLDLDKRKKYMTNYLNTVINSEDKIMKQIDEYNMKKLYEEIELPLMEVLASMEFIGFKIDLNVLKGLGEHFEQKIKVLENKIYELAGDVFNINSPKQLSVVLFEKLGLPVIKKTKTGISTDVEVLQKLTSKHEIIGYIIEYRQMVKLNSTYVEGLKNVIDKNTKRVHSAFNQTVTATGRISSTEPNLQNIPTRTEEGKELRKVFVAQEGYVLCDADYSQIELRVLAHLADEKNLINSFKNNIDIHTKTASEVFHVDIEDVTSTMRSRAKAVNFGIVYGISDYGLSRDLKIPRKEAKQYIENYLAYYSSIDKYMKSIVEESKKNGFVETYFGRRRYIPELSSRNYNIRSFGERIALNTPVQGTAADIIKAAMVHVYKKLKSENLKSRLILQVHDELIVETYENELEEVKRIVRYEMENVIDNFEVHLDADINVGGSWYDAK